MTSRWHAYHLYTAEPFHNFLIRAVRPFVDTLSDEGLIQSFFFVRYFDCGSHVRLRLLTESGDWVDERVRMHFNDFFERHPSSRVTERAGMLPNDSVQLAAYEPEVERYGGPARLPIAEKQFEASSRAVLATLAEDASYERAIGAAIRLHLIFAHALDLDATGACAFFRDVSRRYLHLPSLRVSDAATAARMTSGFDVEFERNRERFETAHSVLWSALEEGYEFEQEWANRWRSDMRDIGRRLRDTSGTSPPGAAEIEIFHSYVHMTNNRLGLHNHDEPFLARILERCFRSALEPAH